MADRLERSLSALERVPADVTWSDVEQHGDAALDLSGQPDRRRFSAVRVAVALLALAGAVAVLALALTMNGNGQGELATGGDSAVPPLVVGDLPEGLSLTTASELPLQGESLESRADIWVYGDPTSDEPFAEDDLGLLYFDAEGVNLDRWPDGPTVAVGDHEGVVVEAADSIDGMTSLFVPSGHAMVVLSSASLAADGLVDLAPAVLAAHEAGEAPPSAPTADLELVTRAEDITAPPWALIMPVPEAPGHLRMYEGADGSTFLAVRTLAGGTAELRLLQWMAGADAETVAIGEGGMIAERPPGPTRVMWSASPGVLVVIDAAGLDRSSVLAAAESLVPEEGNPPDAQPRQEHEPNDEIVAALDGELADGSTWSVELAADGGVCVESGELRECGVVASLGVAPGVGPPAAAITQARTLDTGETLISGVAFHPEHQEVTVTGVDPSGADPAIDVAPAPDETTLFAAVLPPGEEPPAAVVLHDSRTGEELAEGSVTPGR